MKSFKLFEAKTTLASIRKRLATERKQKHALLKKITPNSKVYTYGGFVYTNVVKHPTSRSLYTGTETSSGVRQSFHVRAVRLVLL